MRITSRQESYLIMLLNEAFSKHYSPRGYVAPNQVHRMDTQSASKLIQHLLDAKARGWVAWETTPEGLAESALKLSLSELAQARVAIIKALKAEGHTCNCSEQELDVDKADPTKCALHSRFDVICAEKGLIRR